jgi:hypothetical protein
MKFTLHYEGPLKSANAGGRLGDKHEIRRRIKSQLEVLWKQLPWRDFHDYHFKGPQKIVTELSGIRFAPLISEKKHLTASLKIKLPAVLILGPARSLRGPGGGVDGTVG